MEFFVYGFMFAAFLMIVSMFAIAFAVAKDCVRSAEMYDDFSEECENVVKNFRVPIVTKE